MSKGLPPATTDQLGRLVSLGDTVAYATVNHRRGVLRLGEVDDLNAEYVHVKPLNGGKAHSVHHDCCVRVFKQEEMNDGTD